MDNDGRERDEQLFEKREQYEKEYFSKVIDDMVESSALDKLIFDRLQYFDDNFDFEPSQEYLHLQEIYSNGHGLDDESINSNFNKEKVSNKKIENYDPSDFYDDVLDDVLINENDEDEGYLKDLIDEHLKDEKAFFDSMLIEAIQEEHYFEKAIDDLIMEQIDAQFEEYERSKLVSQFEDYEVDYREPYWYDSPFEDECYWDEDEPVVDPFDSFDEIDYPEGEPQHIYYESINYENEVPDDYSVSNFKYDGEMEFLEIENQEEKRNHELIKEYEKIESLYKDYFTKDDTLDKIIKEKLNDKKFNI